MLLLLLLLLLLMMMLLMLMLLLLLLLGDLFRVLGLRTFVQYADGTILADSVRHFRRVDPHGKLAGEQAVQYRRQQADVRPSLRDYRIHFTVDTYATVAGAAIWPIWEPVIAITGCLVDIATPQVPAW